MARKYLPKQKPAQEKCPKGIAAADNQTEASSQYGKRDSTRAKLKAAFASMTEAIFVADAEGRLTDFNDEFVRYHRFKDRDECSRTIQDCPKYLEAYFSDGTPAPPEQWAMPRALRGETASNVEYRLRRKETGETWWGSYNFAPIKAGDGRIIGAIVAARETTALKQTEEKLRESEARFRVAQELSPDGFAILRPVRDSEGRVVDFTFVYENAAIARINGTDPAAVVGRRLSEFLPAHSQSPFHEAHARVADTGETCIMERKYDGGDIPRPTWFRVVVVRTGQDIAILSQDITERKRAEAALRETDFRLQVALKAGDLGWHDYDVATGKILLDSNCRALWGIGPDEPVDINVFWAGIHPDSVAETKERLEASIDPAGTGRFDSDYLVRPLDGSSCRWVHATGQTVFAGEGADRHPIHVIGTVQDITLRKRTAEALQDSEREKILILDSVNEIIAFHDCSNNLIWANKAYLASTDLPLGDLKGQKCYSCWGLDRLCDKCPVVTAIHTGQPQEAELTPQNQSNWPADQGSWLVRAAPVRDAAGNVVGAIEVAHNITARKQAEVALLHNESMLRAITENSPDPIFLKDRESRILMANPATLAALNKRAEEVLGKTDEEFYDDPDLGRQKIANDRRVLASGQTEIMEEVVPTPDGVRTFLSAKTPYRDAANQIIGIIGIARDITERKRAEDALRRAVEELERSNKDLEQFAYVASHDLQEPLRMVTAFAGLLKDRYQGKFDATGNQYIDFAVEGATRMSQLIQDLLAYSRAGTPSQTPATTSAEVALTEALANLRSTIDEQHATIKSEPLPTVMADSSRLALTLQNLIGNAIKFHRKDVPPVIHVGAQRDGRYWVFSVADNGIGIPRDQFERIFEVFQRLHTRDEYAGTGIGLAICKRTVERQGGRIWVECEQGQGATFKFTLPAVNKDTSAAKPCH